MKNLKKLNLIITVLLLFSVTTAFSQLKEAFQPRYSETLKGDLTIIANNTVSLNRTQPYNGELNNNALDMVYVDIDTDPTTFNSSNANLRNPDPNAACLSIEKVLLYWAASDLGEIVNGVELDNQPNWDYRDVKLRLPGQANYNTIRADNVIYRGRDEHFSNDPYICFKDITADVTSLADPFGTYQVANVEGKIGALEEHDQPNSSTGVSGGWQILVIYKSPDFNLKNISIFDGYAHVTRDRNSFPVSFDGFQTIPNGPVRAEIAFGALEGDRGILGDRLQIRNVANVFEDLVAPSRPNDNFFNSRITIGQPGDDNFTDRNPASLNTLGFDSALFPLRNPGNSIINNNQTSATLRLVSTGETYGLYLLGFAVEVFEPVLVPIIHTATPNPITPSDDPNANVVTYNTQMTNNGNDNAINITFSTTIPLGSELIQPITGLPTGITPNYDNATRILTFTALDGLLDVGDTINFNYQTRVNDRCTFLENGCSATLESGMVGVFQGEINGDTQTTGSSDGTDSCGVGNDNPTTVQVNEPDVATWTTNPGALDVTLECDDLTGLEDAQNQNPVADCANLIPIKTTGDFVPDITACASNGTYTNTWSFTDACGRTIADFVQVITIQDTTPPDLSLCTDVVDETLECTGVDIITIAEQWNQNNEDSLTNCGTDNCDRDTEFNVTSDFDPANIEPTCGGGAILTVVYRVSDDCENSETRTATLTIEDTTPPDVTACTVGNQEAECGTPEENETFADQWDLNNIAAFQTCASDLCSGFSVTSDYDFDLLNTTCGPCGTLTVNYTLADECGNDIVQTLTLSFGDSTPPVFCSIASQTIECVMPDNQGVAEQWDMDNIERLRDCLEDDTVEIESDYEWDNHVPTDCGGITIDVTYTLTDECLNSRDQIITLTIEDTTPPTLENCGSVASETVECEGDGNQDLAFAWNAQNLSTLTGCATDECNPSSNFVSDSDYDWANYEPNPPGECTGGGRLPVNYWVTDDCGNRTENLLVVLTFEDTTPPVLENCGSVANETVECEGDGNEDLAIAWNAQNLSSLSGCATDDCDPNATFDSDSDYDWANFEPNTPGECSGGGRLPVNYWVTDDCGNRTENLLVVLTFEDTTPPVLENCGGVANETVECEGDGNEDLAIAWNAQNLSSLSGCATDDCDPNATFDSDSDYDWANFEPNTPEACTGGGRLPVNYWVTDDCGNRTENLLVVLTFEDTTPPVLENCGSVANETVECEGEGNEDLAINWNNQNLSTLSGCATDDCDPNAVFNSDSDYDWANFEANLPGECSGGGRLPVNYWVTDDCGNRTENLLVILTFEDTTGPQLVTSIQTPITLVCSEVPEVPELEFVDGCSDAEITIEFEEVNGDLGDGSDYQVIRTWTVTDICGNEAVYPQIINVINETLINDLSSERCYDDGPIDLFTFLPGNTDTSGDWIIVSAVNDNIEVNSGVFDPSELDQEEDLGDYVFSYTIAKGYCLEQTEVTITLNDICVVKACGLEDFTISKALTPNGDEFNEFFKVTAVKDCKFKIDVKIFNRYGAIVFQNEDYQNDWSADSHSSSIGGANQLPNGTYYYVIVVTGEFDGGSGLKPLSGPLFIGTK